MLAKGKTGYPDRKCAHLALSLLGQNRVNSHRYQAYMHAHGRH